MQYGTHSNVKWVDYTQKYLIVIVFQIFLPYLNYNKSNCDRNDLTNTIDETFKKKTF